MSPFLLLVIAAAVAFAVYKSAAFKRWRYSKDINFPEVPRRTDLLYGYYASHDEQVAETKDHVNLYMENQFAGQDKAIQNILDMSRTTILDVSAQMFYRDSGTGPFTMHGDALVRLTDFFRRMSDAGALKHVRYLCPIDEPNNTVQREDVLRSAIAIVFEAASQFIELRGVRLFFIYAADKPFICSDAAALIGFDDYDMRSHVLVSDKYKALKASLGVGQKIVLVPGGAYGQDPEPFIRFANANPEVGLVMPFLWFDDKSGNVGALGIRSGPLRAAYREAGRSVCGIS